MSVCLRGVCVAVRIDSVFSFCRSLTSMCLGERRLWDLVSLEPPIYPVSFPQHVRRPWGRCAVFGPTQVKQQRAVRRQFDAQCIGLANFDDARNGSIENES